MNVRTFTTILMAAALLAGAGAFASAASDLQTLQSGDRDRTYRIYRPESLAWAAQVPLVVVLHGGFGGSAQAERAYNWDETADAHGFVVLYPDGFEHSWNAGDCCGPAQRQNVDDVAFLTALVDHVRSAERIDPERIYVTGISNGAMMAYRLACESSLHIAAIGPVAGTLEVPCTAAPPTSVLAIHGLSDGNVPFAGGQPSAGVERNPRRAVPDVVAQWRTLDGCTKPAVDKTGPVTTEAAHCAHGRDVALITVSGAGHQWPGGQPASAAATRILRLDPPSSAIDATAQLWTFFAAHHS